MAIDSSPPQRATRQDAIILAAFGVLFALFVVVSWAKWPLLTADSARELYVPFQIRHGALIYQDFYYLYGPVAPYAQAGLLGIFGERLEVLYVASLAQLAVTMGLLYALSRQLLGPWPSAAVLFLFFTHFALGRDIWGYVWPYSFAATFGVTLGLLLLLSLLRYLANGRLGWLALGGAAIGLSVVTKLEYGFAAAATGALFLAGRLLLGRWQERRGAWSLEALALVGPAMAVAGAVAAAVLARVPLPTVLESVWPTALMRLWNSAGQWHGSGTTWSSNLKLLALEAVVLGLVLGHERLLRFARARPAWALGALALLGGLAWVGRTGLEFYSDVGHVYWMGPGFLLLFGVLAVVGRHCVQAVRAGEPIPVRIVGWGLLAAYGCLVASRTLMTGYNDYTRYQAPVALVAWVALAACWAPGWLRARGWLSASSRVAPTLLTLLVLGLGGKHLYWAYLDYTSPHVAVSAPVGTVLARHEFGVPFNQALGYVQARLRPGEAIVAAPMEASFYLFTGVDNVLKENQLFYGYMTTAIEQRAAIERMRDRRVRYFMLSSYGFGAARFGETFMQELKRWLQQDCRLVADFGDAAYGVRIYETPFSAADEKM